MTDTVPPLGFREMLLDVLRTSVRRGTMNATVRMTSRSISYRRKASALAQSAETEHDELKMLPLVHQALSWIHLAENEELLAESNTDATVIGFPSKT